MADPNAAPVQAGNQAPAAPAPTPVSWVVHPYQVNFNPGTKQGEAIFRNKTKGLAADKRFTLQRKDAQAIRRYFAAKSDSLGSVVTKVPLTFDAVSGNPLTFGNLLTDYGSMSMDRLIRNAHATFGTAIPDADPIPVAPFQERALDPANVPADEATFYKRVHSLVVTELIKNSFVEEEYAKLTLRKKEFAFYDSRGYENIDGACLLKAIFDKIDPNVIVGVDLLRQKIEQTKLHQFKNNVDDMLTSIEESYQKIIENRSSCESIRRYTINALLSGPNDDFNRFIKGIKDDIDSQTGVNRNLRHDQIILAARSKYNNMEATGEWSKVDPKDAKILALTTRLESLENAGKPSATPTSAVHATTGTASQDGKVGGVAAWRTAKKGETMERDGVKWHWCPHHKHPKGSFDGLYCTHTPANHVAWKAERDAKYNKNRNGGTAPSAAPAAPAAPAGDANKLAIGQRLKQVLCTKLMLSDADADAYCNEICQSKD